MNIKLIFVLSLLSFLVLSDKILVVLDNKNLEKTHSQFFSLLQQSSASNQVEFAYSFGKTPIELKYYDRFKYDHIVVLCTSEKGNRLPSQSPKAELKPEKSSRTLMKEEMSSLLEMSIPHTPTGNCSTRLEWI